MFWEKKDLSEQFIMSKVIDLSLVWKFLPQLLPFIPKSLLMLLACVAASLVVGMMLGIIRIYKVPVLHQMATLIISFSRGTPILTQLFIFYYGLPEVLKFTGLDLSRMSGMFFVILTYGLNFGASTAENIRGAISSVGTGQFEAAYSIGMRPLVAFRRIIFPQALAVMIPNMSNTYLKALKNTSLAFSVGVVDLMSKGKILGQTTMHFFEAYLALAIIYYILYLICNRLFQTAERWSLRYMH